MESAVDTANEHVHQGTLNIKPYEFKPGQSGNPAGRPKGARTKLADQFLKDIYEDWKEHGIEAIKKVRVKKPDVYLRVVADLIPKDIKLEIPQLNRIAHVIIDMPSTISTLDDDPPIDLPLVSQPIETKRIPDTITPDEDTPPTHETDQP